MKEILLDIATRLDQIQWAIFYGDPEDSEELEVFSRDILDIVHEIVTLADTLEDRKDSVPCPEQ